MKKHEDGKSKRLKNLRPIDNSNEAINQAKSNGQLARSIARNILATLRTNVEEKTNLLEDVPKGIQAEVNQGKFDNALKLLNIIKEPEKQDIGITGDIELTNTTINIIPVQGLKDGNQS